MKSFFAFCAAMTLCAALAGPVLAEEPMIWSCSWNGTWGEQGQDIADPMSMTGFMFAADGGLVMRANSKDSAGPSHIRGGCGDGECWVEQKYTTGQLLGQSYYFTLTDKAGPYKNGIKTFSYSGTWGEQESVETHHGTIQLTATCKPFSYGKGDEVYTRMDQLLGWTEGKY